MTKEQTAIVVHTGKTVAVSNMRYTFSSAHTARRFHDAVLRCGHASVRVAAAYVIEKEMPRCNVHIEHI